MLESLLAGMSSLHHETTSLRRETNTNAFILNKLGGEITRRLDHMDNQTTFEGQKMWREVRTTRRKLDRLFDSVDNARPAGQSLGFLDLPKEIKAMIWPLAVPRRMVCINKPDKLCHLPTTLSDPAIAQVCHQSRMALAWRSRQPGIWAASLPVSKIPFSQRWQIRIDRGYLWTSFTPETDALLVNPNVHMRHPLREVVQHIVVASGDTCQFTFSSIHTMFQQDFLGTDDPQTASRPRELR